MSNYNTKDALGNEIVFGSKYGYSASSNGITSVKIGRALYFTEKGLCSLDVFIHNRGAYNEELKPREDRTRIAVKPSCLFPVSSEHLNRQLCAEE